MVREALGEGAKDGARVSPEAVVVVERVLSSLFMLAVVVLTVRPAFSFDVAIVEEFVDANRSQLERRIARRFKE